MKKLLLILCLFGVTASYAQILGPKIKSSPVMILLPDSSNLIQLQQILQYSYQWLPKSQAPSQEVTSLLSVMQQLYPMIVPMKKDSTIKVKPPTTK